MLVDERVMQPPSRKHAAVNTTSPDIFANELTQAGFLSRAGIDNSVSLQLCGINKRVGQCLRHSQWLAVTTVWASEHKYPNSAARNSVAEHRRTHCRVTDARQAFAIANSRRPNTAAGGAV